MEVKATKRTDILLVDPKNIVVTEGFNVRQDMGDIDALADSILELGLQVPLKAKKVRNEDKFELVDGHRRFAAVRKLMARGVDVGYIEVMPFKGNEEERVFAMITTGTGQKALNEIEQAEAIKRLVNFGYKADEIAKKIGKSLPHVYNLMALANVSKKIKETIMCGEISGTTVLNVVRTTTDEREQYEMIQSAIKDAKESGKKKATSKNVTGLKTKPPMQKLQELILVLEQNEVQNEKVELLHELVLKLKSGTTDDLVELFK
jgi:ParB family chromosome partitioning protein